MSRAKTLTKQQKTKDAYLRRHFGITLQEYTQVLKHQDGKCAICKLPPNIFKTGFAVDHRHGDGLLRGLLCWKCNRGIGAFQRFHPEAVGLFAEVYKYLLKPPFSGAFGKDRFTIPGKIGTKKRAALLAKAKLSGLKKRNDGTKTN